MGLRTSLPDTTGLLMDYTRGAERQQTNFQGSLSNYVRTVKREERKWVGLTMAFAKAYVDSHASDTNTVWRATLDDPVSGAATLIRTIDSASAWTQET